MEVSGTITPMVTPMTGDGKIDVDTLGTFTDILVQSGVHGLFPVGSIGEFSSLTTEQRGTVIETVVEQSGNCPVLAGCGGTSLANVRQYLSDAAAAGADAGIVVTPFYLGTSQDGLCRFYERLADDTPLPFYLYNIPQLTGINLSVESITRLADHSMIVGLKDSTGDFTYFAEVLESVPDSFIVLQGNPMLGITSFDYGGDGVIAGPANVFPGQLSEFYDAYQGGDRDRSQQLLSTVISPVICTIQTIPSAVAFKYLLNKAGLDVGEPFPPLASLTEEQRRRLDECFHRVNEAGATPLST